MKKTTARGGKVTDPVPSKTVRYDAETIAAIALKVKAEGFVPAIAIRDEFGPDKATQGIAVLYRDFRMFREVRRPWKDDKNALGYEWADRRFSKAEQKKIPPELGFVIDLTHSMAVKYSDFEPVTVRCRYAAAILGSMPVTDPEGGSKNVFDRDAAGNILLLRYHQRAMAAATLPMIGKEQATARRIGWSIIRLPANGNLHMTQRPIMDKGQGKGLLQVEQLDTEGTDFAIRAMVPTSVLSVAEFVTMVGMAGQYVGLSPGRSAGFGDFEVLRAE